MDPRTAQVLAAVLLAAAEQVSSEKQRIFGADSGADLTLLALSMAFRGDDTGLHGDVFEWSLLSAVNQGDPAIGQLVRDALTMIGNPVESPRAVLVAADSGRLVEFSPALPQGAKIMTGKRGRPTLVGNALANATTKDWKVDVLLGAEERWVTASLKVNPKDVVRSCRASISTAHPVRIGITPVRRGAGLERDPESNAVIVRVPVDKTLMALTGGVIADVKECFAKHLEPPKTPVMRDQSGIDVQLYRWRDHTVREVVTTLQEFAEDRFSLTVSDPMPTHSDATDLTGALIALDPLRREPSRLRDESDRPVDQLLHFEPLD
jgi:hypothetical protein